jgi:excisionase family DNA binding protein
MSSARVLDDTPVIMTASEVADLLHVDRKTVYQAVQRGELPHRRLGRRVLFERAAVLSWLREGSVSP